MVVVVVVVVVGMPVPVPMSVVAMVVTVVVVVVPLAMVVMMVPVPMVVVTVVVSLAVVGVAGLTTGRHRSTVHHGGVAATADRAHQTTSMSLIRNSSPETGIIRPLPQAGHGSRRPSISEVSPQS